MEVTRTHFAIQRPYIFRVHPWGVTATCHRIDFCHMVQTSSLQQTRFVPNAYRVPHIALMSESPLDHLEPFRDTMRGVCDALIENDRWLVDCHTHLCSPHFPSEENIASIVEDSLKHRVKYTLVVRSEISPARQASRILTFLYCILGWRE
jgi:hypothetical protein